MIKVGTEQVQDPSVQPDRKEGPRSTRVGATVLPLVKGKKGREVSLPCRCVAARSACSFATKAARSSPGSTDG
eukprot:3605236-Pleurochrysis_carterae.AAC.1